MKKDLSFGTAFCYVQGAINGVRVNSIDFGEQYDHDPENAPDYCCGDMRFDPKPSTPEVLKKYSITEQEYKEICDDLTEGLSFGSCGWCE